MSLKNKNYAGESRYNYMMWKVLQLQKEHQSYTSIITQFDKNYQDSNITGINIMSITTINNSSYSNVISQDIGLKSMSNFNFYVKITS